LIAAYFLPPQHRIAFWFEISTAAVTVPKATVNEHCQLLFWKNEIGFAKQRRIPTPSMHSIRAQK